MKSSRLASLFGPFVRGSPRLRAGLRGLSWSASTAKHTLAQRWLGLITPAPDHLTIAVTAACNLRCSGCRYGRDFMIGKSLPVEKVVEVLEDGRRIGVNQVRFYGGEPLLHKDLPTMVERTVSLGMEPYLTTNGILLGKRIDDLHRAGLRAATIGFYGIGQDYDHYTQRPGRFAELEKSLESVRERYGDQLRLQLNWVLTRLTCSSVALERAWEFARRFGMVFHVDLVSYSLPFFNDGRDGELPFRHDDEPSIRRLGKALARLKQEHPEQMPQPLELVRAIPDLLIEKEAMRLPCDAYRSLWIGADGTVQLCDVTFKLGNVHERSLAEIVGTPTHRQACRDAFTLSCPNCTCRLTSRLMTHGPSRRRYGKNDPSVPHEV